MASDPAINLEEDDANRDIDCNPYFPFSSLISDSESDSEPDPYISPIDFFDRESQVLTSDDFFNIWGFYNPKENEEIVLGSGSDQQGLRVTGIDSDSDYEDDVANESGRVEVVGTGLPPVWDEEWEEVQSAINLTVFSEELSSESIDDDDQLDWQVLLAVNNAVNYMHQADIDIDSSYYMYLASLDEYDDVIGQMFDNEIGIRGNPPAGKCVVDDLPVVVLTVEELNNGDIVCAVCKDEMVVHEEVKRLPCMHLYHGECIVPWLGVRNTCPVCRFELPTDDVDYERYRGSLRSGDSLFLTG